MCVRTANHTQALLKEKDSAVRGQDFEKAGSLRDREMELKAQISAITSAKREEDKAETEAGAGPVVTEGDIASIVASWTGIPVEKVSSDESKKLLKMEETLHNRIIGQEDAVVAISRAVRRARVGLKSPNRPIASFIFSGPTGVGKSELCKVSVQFPIPEFPATCFDWRREKALFGTPGEREGKRNKRRGPKLWPEECGVAAMKTPSLECLNDLPRSSSTLGQAGETWARWKEGLSVSKIDVGGEKHWSVSARRWRRTTSGRRKLWCGWTCRSSWSATRCPS